MSLATIHSRALVGISAPAVIVEVHLSRGLPAFSIVGMPEIAVRESRDRVRSAILNSGFEFPNRKIAVNLAPADLPKEGSRFDLPIAIGVLAASGQVPMDAVSEKVFVGELALSGALRKISGALITSLSMVGSGVTLILPRQSAAEASLVSEVSICGVDSLVQLSEMLNGAMAPEPFIGSLSSRSVNYPDISDVAGQTIAKKALEFAAAGGHSMLMMGSPGAGKTMLASRLPGLLPELTESEALESAAIQSLDGGDFDISQWKSRPFRAPHHSASCASLIGGGSIPRPGEVSRAHNGVLFLDEFTEFGKKTLDQLREPIESGYVDIARVAHSCRFPARFLLVAAANPCRCGYLGDPCGKCKCTPDQVQNYLSRISGPLLDRIDIQIHVQRVQHHELSRDTQSGEPSKAVKIRVEQARNIQLNRQGRLNSDLGNEEIKIHCALATGEKQLLEKVFVKNHLSARGYHRILKLARTIADCACQEIIGAEHLSLAINLRHLDRNWF